MSVRESFFQAIVTFQALAEKVENVLKVLRGLMEKDVVAEEYRWLLEEDEEDEEDAWGGAGEENDAGEDGEGREEGEKKEEGGKVAAVRRGEASGQGEQERKGDDEKGTAGGKGTQAVMVPTSEKEAGDDGGERSGLGVTEEMEKAKKKGEVKMEEVGGEREKEKEKDTNAQEGKEKGDKRDTGNAVMGIGSGEKGKGGKANREDEEVPPTQEGARRASESRDEEAPPKNDESASGAEEGYPNNEEITSDAEAGSAAVPRSQRLPFPVGPDLAALVDR